MALLRRLLVLIIAASLAASPAFGVTPAQRLMLNTGPGWILKGSAADLYFARNGGSCALKRKVAPCSSLLTMVRASTGYAQWADGHLSLFAANAPRITDQGLLVEEARTNVVLWDRDLTNAAWTKTNVTAALNQAGADGAANSASSLTATAGNGTVLQAITLASSARFQSAYVKRLTGTGAINMTMDNGATWTAISVTAAYTKLTIPTQTLANPTVGFQIVTSGDAIAVDFVQNENGTFATSPIPTTTVAVTRAADNIKTTNLNLAPPYSIVVSVGPLPLSGADLVNTGSLTNGAGLYYGGGSGTLWVREASVSTASVSVSGPGANAAFKEAGRYVVNDVNIGAIGVVGTHDTSSTPPTLSILGFGTSQAGFSGSMPNGYFRRLTVFPTGLSDGQLQALTQ